MDNSFTGVKGHLC